jgi:hypothetical protein
MSVETIPERENLSKKIQDFLTPLKVTVHSSAMLAHGPDGVAIHRDILQKLKTMTPKQQDRLKSYTPTIQFVLPSKVDQLLEADMLVNCTDPVNHLMKLLDQADEDLKKIHVSR